MTTTRPQRLFEKYSFDQVEYATWAVELGADWDEFMKKWAQMESEGWTYQEVSRMMRENLRAQQAARS